MTQLELTAAAEGVSLAVPPPAAKSAPVRKLKVTTLRRIVSDLGTRIQGAQDGDLHRAHGRAKMALELLAILPRSATLATYRRERLAEAHAAVTAFRDAVTAWEKTCPGRPGRRTRAEARARRRVKAVFISPRPGMTPPTIDASSGLLEQIHFQTWATGSSSRDIADSIVGDLRVALGREASDVERSVMADYLEHIALWLRHPEPTTTETTE
jgi:hypothetical protein